jgi:hypothetical protein
VNAGTATADDVVVQQSWATASRIFIAYRHPERNMVIGCTRRRHSPELYRVYGPEDPSDESPEIFGWNVADFDLGEPLFWEGTEHEPGPLGIEWWGDLDEDWREEA